MSKEMDLVMKKLEEIEQRIATKGKRRSRKLPEIKKEIGVVSGMGTGNYHITIDDVNGAEGVHIAKKIGDIYTKNNVILPRTKETKNLLMKAFKGV